MTAMTEMPRYQSHKRVWALQIASIEGRRLTFVEKGFAPVDCPEDMFSRYKPKTGDYLVEYEGDGYRSFSPKEAFEGGYTRI